MKRLFIIQMLLWCALVVVAQKQTFTIQGTIIDPSFNNEPLSGVNVYLKDRPGVGTASDIDGKFLIKASKGDMIVFTYLGYDNFEYQVAKEEKNLVVKMVTSSVQLEEAVVTAMGNKQRKISVLSAVSTVDTKDLQVPSTSINNMLGGRVAGVISLQTSGEPGKNISEFWVRGMSTFGANSSALVLIDGLEGDLSHIEPADIESFSVLKDASATAVYGVRGANGVVLVTTKRGTVDRLRITARANLTVSTLKRLPEYVGAYDYAKLANEARVVSGSTPLYSPMEMDLIKYQLDPDLYPDVNWQNEVLNKTSLQQTYYINAQGGGSIARYFISLGMSDEGAAYKQDKNSKYKAGSGYNTYNYRTNLDVNVTKTTQVYLGLDGTLTSKKEPGMANTDYLWYAQAALTPLTIPTKYSNGMLPAYGTGSQYSPYVMLNHTGMKTSETYSNMVTLALTQDFSPILKGLKVKIQGALNNKSYYDETRYVLPDMYYAVGRSTDGELKLVKKINAEAAQFMNYQRQWRKYHFEANVNYENMIGDDHRFTGLLYYYMSDEKDTYNVKTSMDAIPKRYQGLSGRVTYGFKDTYFIDANFGYTGSENFRPGQQFGFFPSGAVGWVPTNYDFMKKALPWLNFLKFRFSYGQVGNDRISDKRFPYLTIINSTANTGWGSRYSWGVNESIVGADNLAWEKSTKADLGIEGRLFDERVNFVVDFFNDQREGIFQQRTQVPDFAGIITMPFGNVGRMRSYGSDGNISYTQTFGKDFAFTVRGNFTYSTNDVQDWEQAYPKYEYQRIAGNPLNIQRGYIALGLFKDDQDVASSPAQFGTVRPGDIKYKDVNGDGKITTDDKVPLSFSDYPRLMYGFGGEFRYKNLTLSVLFKGTGNTDYYKAGLPDGYGNYDVYEMGYIPFHKAVVGNVPVQAGIQANRWTPAWYSGDPSTENPDAMFPRLTYGKNESNTQVSTFWKGNSKYLRLQEISLTYNLKSLGWLNNVGISSVDLQLVGYNLCVWDKVKTVDPEQAGKNGNVYPIPARYAIQMYVNF